MLDDRFFSERYDLYRPTIVTSDAGQQTRSLPPTPTAAAQRCLFFPTPGATQPDREGLALEFDATLLVPAGADLRPAQVGGLPDQIEVSGRRFVVLVCWPAAGMGIYRKALLKEQAHG